MRAACMIYWMYGLAGWHKCNYQCNDGSLQMPRRFGLVLDENVLEKARWLQYDCSTAEDKIPSCHTEDSDQQQNNASIGTRDLSSKGKLCRLSIKRKSETAIHNEYCHHQETVYDQLYYFETSPTFCSVTRGRRCLHPDNCATLCCGRGYTTKVIKTLEKCRCRFTNGRCCQVVCDYCEKYEDRYYCK